MEILLYVASLGVVACRTLQCSRHLVTKASARACRHAIGGPADKKQAYQEIVESAA